MKVVHNEPVTQWVWYTMGQVHNRTGTQWIWYTMRLARDTMRLEHNGTGTRDWDTVGTVHNGTGAQ